MSGIFLSSAVRTNLTTLQSTSALQGKIQERLSTGLKVNSALDNPSSFFTASSLNRRANDLSSLLDSMQQGVKTLEAADNGMKSITKTIEFDAGQHPLGSPGQVVQSANFSMIRARPATSSSPAALSARRRSAWRSRTALHRFTPLALTWPRLSAARVETYGFTVAKNGGAGVAVSLALPTTPAVAPIWIWQRPSRASTPTSRLAVRRSGTRQRRYAGRLELYDTDATNVGTAASIDVSNQTTAGTAPTAGASAGPATLRL